MPTYVYECPTCKDRVELVQKFDEKAPTCEKCEHHPVGCPDGCSNGPDMVKVIVPSTFILKGSGWAKDGYGGGKK